MMRKTRDRTPACVGALFLGLFLVTAAPSSGGALHAEHVAVQQLPPSLQPADPATRARVETWLDAAGTGWTPNLGQIADADGRPAADVLFEASTPGARVFVTRTGLTHLFVSGREDESEAAHAAPGRAAGLEDEAGPGEREPATYDWARIDLTLDGAAIRPEQAEPRRRLEGQGTRNYYLAHCPAGVLDVPEYGEVTFPAVYPGIDWVVRGEADGGVHHDFVVAPGADPAAIRLRYAGATSLTVSADGQSLIATTALGQVREGGLLCHQGDATQPVAARFELSGDVVTVRLGDYDRSRPLVIDPPLAWSTYYGGNDYDGPLDIYCDNASATLYVVGYNASTNLPTLNPGGTAYYQGTFSGDRDAFILKFTQLGARLWATYYGGGGSEGATSCAGDAAGNLYVGGYTSSTNLPLQNLAGAYNQPTQGGLLDAFILKFDAAGVRQWGTYFGGSGQDQLQGLATDAAGRLFACGSTTSPNLPVMNPGGGAYAQGAIASFQDAWVTRFGTNGALEWSTFLGGAGGDDDALGLVTNAGSVYVAGLSFSPTFPTLNPGGGAYFQGALSGVEDGYIARFSLAGVLQWSTYFGGSSYDVADEPAVDAAGHVYVLGVTGSSDLPTYDPGGGAYYQPASGGGDDLFVARFDAANAPVWATYFGGSQQEGVGGHSITLDTQGRVSVTALTGSPDFPVFDPANGSYFNGSYGGLRDAIIAQFGPNSALLWSTYWGSASTDFGSGVATNLDGCLFVTGESVEFGSMPTLNPGLGAWYQATNHGSDDGFITKFCTPSSACCLDFNCVPVSSAAECQFLGGTAFYPGQPCSTTVCTILCTICGHKFNDLNHDGVPQNGEPGLAGWTIQLSYPNNLPYATTVTDAQGDYCFNNIPCGPWLVSEVHQPGWVQTFPSTAAHALNTVTGSTTNGVDFGNYACAGYPPCTAPPTGLAAWWPFDDQAPTSVARDVAHTTPPRNGAQLFTGGSAPGALCLASVSDHALVPAAEQQDLDFGAGAFSVAAWLQMQPGGAGVRMVADARALDSSSGALGVRGWALWLEGTQSFLSIGTGDTPQVVPGPRRSARRVDASRRLRGSRDRRGAVVPGRRADAALLDFTPLGRRRERRGRPAPGSAEPRLRGRRGVRRLHRRPVALPRAAVRGGSRRRRGRRGRPSTAPSTR